VESNGRTHALFVDGGNNSVMVGDATVARTVFGQNSCLQVEGTDSTATMSIFRNSNDDNGAELVLGSSRGTSTGSNTVVQDDDNLGRIAFVGADGTDAATPGALIMAQVDGTPGGNDLPTKLVFSTTADGASSATERMRIKNTGTVLINTTSTSVGNDGVRIFPEGSGTGTFTEFMNDGGGITMRISRGGSDGICTQFARGSSVVGSISVDSSNTTYSTSSDYRLKENVLTDWDATSRLKQLKPSRFSWIIDKKSEPTQDGFLAHEVMNVVPEAIVGTKDEVHIEDDDIMGLKKGDPVYQTIDQSKLVPLLTKALQEAISEIDTLKEKVKALESK
jgi:hypothetical protein